MLLDEQAVCYDMCLKTMAKCREDGKKRTIVIQGGPGTGKSVLAVNLLMEFINKSLNASYVTKNSAPRNAFLSLLTHSDAKKLVDIKQLFRSPFGLANVPADTYDCVVLKKSLQKKKLYMGTKCCRAMRKCFGCVWRCCAVQISCDYILPKASLMMPSIPGFAALRAPHPSSPARRGGAKQIEAQRPAAFRAFFVQGLTGAGLPTALYEKSPAQSAELQFVCGETGSEELPI